MSDAITGKRSDPAVTERNARGRYGANHSTAPPITGSAVQTGLHSAPPAATVASGEFDAASAANDCGLVVARNRRFHDDRERTLFMAGARALASEHPAR